MAESLVGTWSGELRAALAAGAARDPARVPDGSAWLLSWALLCMSAAAVLFSLGGYQFGFAALNAFAATVPPALREGLTVLGDEQVALALALLLARRHPRVFWTLVCAAVVASAYTRGLKPLIDAPRPPAVLQAGEFSLIGEGYRSRSFPSGHSATAAVFFGVLAYYARRCWRRLLLLLIATLAGLSRVAVGVHWPIDVLAGLAGGAAAVVIGAWLARRSPWGVLDEGVHLAFVVLAAFAAAGLLLDDRGYPGAAIALQLLGGAALATALLQYLVVPLAPRAFTRRG